MTDSNEKQEKRNTKNNYNLNHHPHKEQKLTLKILVLAIIVSAIFANSIIILSDQDNRLSTSLWILNITAAIASSLGIIATYRHGLRGTHGKSYLFLTLGLISWFSALGLISWFCEFNLSSSSGENNTCCNSSIVGRGARLRN